MKEILNILKNYKFLGKYFWFYVLFGLLVQIGFLYLPKLFQGLMYILEVKGSYDQFYHTLFITGLVVLGIIIVEFFNDIIGNYVWQKLYAEKNKDYKKRILDIDYIHIANSGTGKLIAKVTNGIRAEVDVFTSVFGMFFTVGVRGVSIIVIFLLTLPIFVGFLASGVVLLYFINRLIYKKLDELGNKSDETSEKTNKNLSKIIMDNLLIKIYNKKKMELDTANQLHDTIVHYDSKISLMHICKFIIFLLMLRVFELGIYLVLGLKVLKGEMPLSQLIMITYYLWWMWDPIQNLVSQTSRIAKNLITYRRLNEFITLPNNVVNGDIDYNYTNGEIKFNNIKFGYSKEKDLFESFNLNIQGGKTTALVGHSGSGKSTLVKLILRLSDPTTGEIFIDGQNLKNIKIESFYDKIGYLSQDPAVFDGTIKENLEYSFVGDIHDESLLWDALEKVDLYDLVKNSPDGLNTEIGERGLKLSGGEKQRLAIARIFLRDPKILILDEPTSALDSISEHKITQLINQIMKGRTVIVIAHRLQTVVGADSIVVMEKGKIIQMGTHIDLLTQKGGIYSNLVDLQRGVLVE